LAVIWRLLALAGGAGVFLVLNLFLLFDRCSTNEFMVNCGGGSGRHTAPVLFVLGMVGAASLITSIGRNFAIGFVATLLGLAVVTTGACTPSWTDPYYSGMRRWVRPHLDARATRRKIAERRRDWIAAMNARPMDLARGVELAGEVAGCASREAAKGAAPTESALRERCDAMRDVSVAGESSPWVRYTIPVARGEDAMGQPIDQVLGDPGWRVRYEPVPPSGYVVRVEPDELLDEEWPRVAAYASGRFEVQPSADVAPQTVSPVADLRAMVACLKAIPAEEDRRRAKHGGLSYGWFLTSMARRVCPALASRLRAPIPNDENTTLLSMQVSVAGGAQVEVAAYAVQFEIRQPANAPFAFDLLARSVPAGLPRYLATFEGAVHSTTDARAATATDPVVAP